MSNFFSYASFDIICIPPSFLFLLTFFLFAFTIAHRDSIKHCGATSARSILQLRRYDRAIRLTLISIFCGFRLHAPGGTTKSNNKRSEQKLGTNSIACPSPLSNRTTTCPKAKLHFWFSDPCYVPAIKLQRQAPSRSRS